MYVDGILLGAVSFLVIGLFHPIVIKAEYHFGAKCWPVFLAVGFGMIGLTLIVDLFYLRVILGLVAFSCFWSIHELFQQEKRVARGWFPKNPRRESKENSSLKDDNSHI